MSVLKGEGKVVILYGTISIPSGPRAYSGYLARPDLTGEWPTILLIPSAWGVTSSVKDLCRRLARQGFAVLAPDVFRGSGPSRSADRDDAEMALAAISDDRVLGELEAVIEFIANPAGFWSSAERGFGVLALGSGGRLASLVAGRSALVAALALVGPHLLAEGNGAGTADLQLASEIPVLGFSGREDDTAPPTAVAAVREAVPQAEWVIYDGAGADYWDDYLPSYDVEIVADTWDRLAAFYERSLSDAP